MRNTFQGGLIGLQSGGPSQICQTSNLYKADIQLNESLFFGSPKMISYGLVVQIAGLSEWEDKHILDMAFVAHEKFVDQYAQDILNKRYLKPKLKLEEMPAVTTTMIVDNTAYISTSLKGKGSYIYDPALSLVKNNHPCEGPVLDGLRRCQEQSLDVAGKTRIHRRSAKCGTFELCVGRAIV